MERRTNAPDGDLHQDPFPEYEAEIVRALGKAGARVEIRGKYLQNPLHYAAEESALETINAILDAGADIGVRDKDGLGPVDLVRRNLGLKADSPMMRRLGPAGDRTGVDSNGDVATANPSQPSVPGVGVAK